MALSTAYAVLAAHEAILDAKWTPEDEESLCRTGVAVGIGKTKKYIVVWHSFVITECRCIISI